jgi:hypothetical protein
VICIEAKSALRRDPRWCKPAASLAERPALKVVKKIGVYLGRERLTYDGFEVWPLPRFLEALHTGKLF